MEKAPEGRHQEMNIKAQRSGPGKGTARVRYLDVAVKFSIGYCGWSRREEGGRTQVLRAVWGPLRPCFSNWFLKTWGWLRQVFSM